MAFSWLSCGCRDFFLVAPVGQVKYGPLVSLEEHERGELTALVQQVVFGCAMTTFLHFKMGINQVRSDTSIRSDIDPKQARASERSACNSRSFAFSPSISLSLSLSTCLSACILPPWQVILLQSCMMRQRWHCVLQRVSMLRHGRQHDLPVRAQRLC